MAVDLEKSTKNNKKFEPVEFRVITHHLANSYTNIVFRKYVRELKESELKVLIYIQDRTCSWLREGFICSTKELIDGYGTDKEHRGTGLTKKSIYNAIKRLEKLGLIYTTVRGVKRIFWINLSIVTEEENKQIAEPVFKKKNEQWALVKSMPYLYTQLEPALVIKKLLSVNNRNEITDMLLKKPKNEKDTPSENKTLEQIEQTGTGNKQPKQKKVKQDYEIDVDALFPAKKSVKKGSVVEKAKKAWLKGVTELYGDTGAAILDFGGKEYGQMKTFIPKLNLTDDQILDFFYHVGRNWREIINGYYSWMTFKSSAKNTPSLGFLISKPDGFIASYNAAFELNNYAAPKVISRGKSNGNGLGSVKDIYRNLVNDLSSVDFNSPEYLSLPNNLKLDLRDRMMKVGLIQPQDKRSVKGIKPKSYTKEEQNRKAKEILEQARALKEQRDREFSKREKA